MACHFFSRGSSPSRDQTLISYISCFGSLSLAPPGKPLSIRDPNSSPRDWTPIPLHWEYGFLITGPPGKSQDKFLAVRDWRNVERLQILGWPKSLFRFSIPSYKNRNELFVLIQSRLTLCNPMDCSTPGSSVPGIFQARILEWVAISSSKGSSSPRDWTLISCGSGIGRQILYHWATWEAPPAPPQTFWPTQYYCFSSLVIPKNRRLILLSGRRSGDFLRSLCFGVLLTGNWSWHCSVGKHFRGNTKDSSQFWAMLRFDQHALWLLNIGSVFKDLQSNLFHTSFGYVLNDLKYPSGNLILFLNPNFLHSNFFSCSGTVGTDVTI